MLAALAILSALTAQPAIASPCRVLVSPKNAGEAVFAEDTLSAPCPSKRDNTLLRYDRRRGLVVTRVALAAGAELGAVWLPLRPAVAAGETVSITAGVGHVVISRQAQALQPAKAGQKFFVRTEDGAIFAAPPVPETNTMRKGTAQ
jgi:flagella basal body P-ring formation protein FlgA